MSIGFRDQEGDFQYRVTIDSDSFWTLSYGGTEPIDSGNIDTLLLIEPGEENVVELYVEGEVGALALNGDEIATLELTEEAGPGDVWIATAAEVETTLVGRETEYRDFQVWALE